MCTAATYKSKDFYFGRTLDYEFSYGDQIVITPRNYSFHFRYIGDKKRNLLLQYLWKSSDRCGRYVCGRFGW